MPELPEVEALVRDLSALTSGQRVSSIQLGAIAALKTFDPGLADLEGQAIAGWRRRGKFVVWELESVAMVIHLGRAGWVRWHDRVPPERAKGAPGKAPPAPSRPKLGRGPLALRVVLDHGGALDVTEMGHEKHLAIWILNDADQLPQLARLGPDPLDPAFDVAGLAALARASTFNLKTFLTRQEVMAGVGNAYSDEALHAARLSPFKSAARLSDEELVRLHHALVGVLTDAVARSVGLSAGDLKSEKKRSMRVHGRTGQACPVCG
ncbi:MAG: Fpg/Nei family DNA glycosylase, partial [Acidimicrobiales bacterium]